MRVGSKSIIYISLFLILVCNFVSADQNTIHISGRVWDKNTGLSVPDVKITITELSEGTVDSVFTDAGGMWEYDIVYTSVYDALQMPTAFEVSDNYPNPFNPSTQVNFSLSRPENVEILVYNTLGVIVDSYSAYFDAGAHTIEWQGGGSAGVYFLLVKTSSESKTVKMIQADGGNRSGASGFRVLSVGQLMKPSTAVSLRFSVEKFGWYKGV